MSISSTGPGHRLTNWFLSNPSFPGRSNEQRVQHVDKRITAVASSVLEIPSAPILITNSGKARKRRLQKVFSFSGRNTQKRKRADDRKEENKCSSACAFLEPLQLKTASFLELRGDPSIPCPPQFVCGAPFIWSESSHPLTSKEEGDDDGGMEEMLFDLDIGDDSDEDEEDDYMDVSQGSKDKNENNEECPYVCMTKASGLDTPTLQSGCHFLFQTEAHKQQHQKEQQETEKHWKERQKSPSLSTKRAFSGGRSRSVTVSSDDSSMTGSSGKRSGSLSGGFLELFRSSFHSTGAEKHSGSSSVGARLAASPL